MRFYLACKKAGVPVEMHIYEKGRHGVGLGSDPEVDRRREIGRDLARPAGRLDEVAGIVGGEVEEF